MATKLSKKEALLIACKALNPYLTFDLLRKGDNGVEPIPGAGAIGIKDTLAQIDLQDKKFGLHVIDHIVQTIFEESDEMGFSVVLGESELLDEEMISTIDDLAISIRQTSSPKE